MTIIKKRGRIVRNIFVIDRYDGASLRRFRLAAGKKCFHVLSVWTLMPADEPYVGYIQRSFSDPKVEKSKWRAIVQLSCETRAICACKALCLLPSKNSTLKESFTNYNGHKVQSLNRRSVERNVGIREDTIN